MSFVYPIVTATDPAGRRNALNEALQAGQEYLLLLPEGVTLTEEMLQAFTDAAKNAPADVAVLAARVLPWGPDWHCSPITLEADCMRLEAVLINCMLTAAAGGFDRHLTGAAADADLCWRLRGAGCRLLYCPQIVAEDERPENDTLENYISEVTSAAVLQAAYGKTGAGLKALAGALRTPRHYPGVRKALAKALPAAALHTLRAGLTPAPIAALHYYAGRPRLWSAAWPLRTDEGGPRRHRRRAAAGQRGHSHLQPAGHPARDAEMSVPSDLQKL